MPIKNNAKIEKSNASFWFIKICNMIRLWFLIINDMLIRKYEKGSRLNLFELKKNKIMKEKRV